MPLFETLVWLLDVHWSSVCWHVGHYVTPCNTCFLTQDLEFDWLRCAWYHPPLKESWNMWMAGCSWDSRLFFNDARREGCSLCCRRFESSNDIFSLSWIWQFKCCNLKQIQVYCQALGFAHPPTIGFLTNQLLGILPTNLQHSFYQFFPPPGNPCF